MKAGYGAAAAGVALMTALIHAIPGATRIANVSMLYLLVVIGAALWLGSGPAVLASLLAFLAFDFFFVQPHHTLTVRDPAEWLALLMFLLTAATTGHLTAAARRQAREARQREREAAALAEASWAVASQVDRGRALLEVLRRLGDVADPVAAAILAPEGGSELTLAARWEKAPGLLPDLDAAGEVLRRVRERGAATDPEGWPPGSEVEGAGAHYLPLAVEGRVLGVLYLRLPGTGRASPEARRAVGSLAHHAAVILERERLAGAETQARVLEEADRLKTALLSMVSHDFRSPLASIKASASALLQEGGPMEAATQRELLIGIDQEADRMNRMVGNILSLSRLEADAWRPQCEATDAAELIGTALGSFTAEQNQRIRVELQSNLAELCLDPVQMAQVLHNLVDNALKYSPADQGVTVVARREGARAIVEVLDRGPGIPEREAERIFERFYRAPGFREGAVPGVGIGLAVCRGLVEAHGGRLSARARSGGGTVFRVDLPAA